MLLPAAGEQVVGALCEVAEADYVDTLARLDALEGFRPNALSESLYLREHCTVQLVSGGEREAWVYVGKPQHVIGLEPFGGDWVAYSAEHRSVIDAFWKAYNNTNYNPDLTEDTNQP